MKTRFLIIGAGMACMLALGNPSLGISAQQDMGSSQSDLSSPKDPGLAKPGMQSPPPGSAMPPIAGEKSGFPHPDFPTVKGELLKIEGEFYTIKDPEGYEVRLRTTGDSQIDKNLVVGDKVIVQRNVPGAVTSIKKASSSGDSSMGAGSGSR